MAFRLVFSSKQRLVLLLKVLFGWTDVTIYLKRALALHPEKVSPPGIFPQKEVFVDALSKLM